MVLYLARLGIGHSVINLMDQIGIFVGAGDFLITLVTSSVTSGATSGRVCDHMRHWGQATRDL